MNSDLRPIELQLLGQKVQLRSSGTELSNAATELVKARIAAAEARIPSGLTAPHLPAVLALFDLAEEYLEAKKRVEDHHLEVETKIRELRQRVDQENQK